MAGGLNRLFARRTARSALGALVIFGSASACEAQWLPPLGAAPPGEIAARLRAQGFVLTGPLYRRNSVYVVDVSAGREGRERLIIDAWSGEILQRFVTHRGRWRPEDRGEYGGPPGVFGPPPASDFYAAGPGGAPNEPARAKPKPRSAETNRQPARATPAQPENGQTGGGSPPAPAAASSTPPSASSASPAAAPPPAAAETASPAAPASNPPATASAAEPEKPAGVAPPAEPNSSTAPAPSTASGEEAPKETATAAASHDAEKPKTESAIQPQAPSGGAASTESTAEKQAPPQAAPAPRTASETGKSVKPKGGETVQAEAAGATPPGAAKSVAAPAAKSPRKSRVNDIPVMPLD